MPPLICRYSNGREIAHRVKDRLHTRQVLLARRREAAKLSFQASGLLARNVTCARIALPSTISNLQISATRAESFRYLSYPR